MALKTFVFISSVNNLSDARYCAGMDVDLIGFSMEKDNKNFISPDVYKELTEWLSGVDFVGEFEDSNVEDINETLSAYDTSVVKINQPEWVEPLKNAGFTVILRQHIDQLNLSVDPDYLVIEGDDEVLNEAQIDTIKAISGSKVLIGFGVNDQNVEKILTATDAYGIALKGSDEIRPGYKDYDELADILEALEIDDLAD